MKTRITPEQAGELLSRNTLNRNLSRGLVAKYANEILAGRWKYNGDAIRISETGVLLDGQHRLHAILRAKTAIEVNLIDGLPDDVRGTIDCGRGRRAADVLAMQGVENASTVASAIRLTVNYLEGVQPSNSSPCSTSQIEMFFSDNGASLNECAALARTADGIVAPAPLAAVLFLALRAPTFSHRARQFVEPLAKGHDLAEGDARLALRNAIINARMRSPGGRAPATNFTFNIVAACWNAFAVNAPLKHARVGINRAGKINVPDIVGGPKFGAGADALLRPQTVRAARAK